MSKVFFTYEQQLDKLEKDKGLIIVDRSYAESMLKDTIRAVLNKCTHISEQQLYGYMGFPSDWDKITKYKK